MTVAIRGQTAAKMLFLPPTYITGIVVHIISPTLLWLGLGTSDTQDEIKLKEGLES